MLTKRNGTMIIVGTGLDGGNAADSLRQEGFAGRVVLLGDEPTIPFGRPPLSKTYLIGSEDLKAWYVKPRDWYESNAGCRHPSDVALEGFVALWPATTTSSAVSLSRVSSPLS